MVRRTVAEDLVYPDEHKPWFRAAPPEFQERLRSRWMRSQLAPAELQRAGLREARRRVFVMSALFASCDLLLCSFASLATGVVLGLVGIVVGILVELLDAGRLLAILLGVPAFVVGQFLSRGGVPVTQMFCFLFIGAGCAWLGIRREERFYDV